MQLILTRTTRTKSSTIGELTHEGKHVCYILEDHDRGLHSGMSLAVILRHKVYSKTAIPTGTYKVINTYSPRFKRNLPLLVDVKGFAGIRIHAGNTAAHAEGCLLPGTTTAPDFVANSRVAFNALLALMQSAWDKKEDVFITIQ